MCIDKDKSFHPTKYASSECDLHIRYDYLVPAAASFFISAARSASSS